MEQFKYNGFEISKQYSFSFKKIIDYEKRKKIIETNAISNFELSFLSEKEPELGISQDYFSLESSNINFSYIKGNRFFIPNSYQKKILTK